MTDHTSSTLFGGHDFKLEVVRRTAYAILSDRPDLAEEALSEAVIKLLEVPEDRQINNVDAYAAEVTRNKARDQLRRSQREVQLAFGSSDDDTKVSREAHSKIAGAKRKADARRARQEFVLELSEILKKHPEFNEIDQSIIDLILEGLSQTAIALELGITRKTVYNRIKRIKERVKGMEPPDDDDPGPGRGPPFARGSPTTSDELRALLLARTKSCRGYELNLEQEELKCLEKQRKRIGRPTDAWKMEAWKGEIGLSLKAEEKHELLTAKEKRELTERFKELFVQLPAFRECTSTPGPQSFDEILEVLGSADCSD